MFSSLAAILESEMLLLARLVLGDLSPDVKHED